MDLYIGLAMYLCCIFMVRFHRYSWHNNKDTLKFIFEFCIIAFVALFISSYAASATTESFIEDELDLVTYTVTDTPQAAYLRINNITFQEVSTYQDLRQIVLSLNQDYLLDGGAPNSAGTTCTIKDGGTTIGTGTISYGKLGTTDLNVYLYLDTWNIGSRTGAQNFSVEYNYTQLYNLKLHNWSARPAGIDKLGFYWSNATTFVFSEDYHVYHSAYWRNDYTYNIVGGLYRVHINKSLAGHAYNSTWIVNSPTMEWLNETGTPSATNNSITAIDAPLTLTVYSNYNTLFTRNIFSISGEHSLEGYTQNSKTGIRVPGVLVSLNTSLNNVSNSGGYYYLQPDTGTYNLTASVSGYQDYTSPIVISSNTWFDIPLAQNLTVSASEVGIYGLVLDSNTGEGISSARVDVENSSYDVTTYTNQAGYFEFTGLLNDTYDVTATKSGYYGDHNSVNASTLGTAYYTILYLVDESAIVTPTATEPTDQIDKQRSAIINLFVNVFGIPESWINPLIALLIILFCTIMVGVYVGYDGALYGAIGGFLITIAMGLIPFYLVIVAICLGGAVLVWNRGD